MATTNKPVSVLFVLNSLCFGGAEKHVVSLLNHLDTKTFRPSLVYLKPEENLRPQIRADRLQVIFCADVRSKVDWQAVRRLAYFIDSAEIDVVVCTNTYSMLYGVLARALSKRSPKLVEVFHSTLLQNWKEKLQMAFYWPFFRGCDTLVYVCGNQRRYWRGKGLRAKTDAVIYNGIDTDYFSDTYSSEEKQQLRQRYGFAANDYLVGICAALRPEKAHGDLLQAVARLRAAGIPAKCLIIGEGVERPAIERRINELGLVQHVAITGFQADVRPFVAACDAMALVSHAVETFSISALEAMALGKPMVMSHIGGADEQMQPGVNGYLYEAGDVDALAEALTQLAEPERRGVMGGEASNIVRSQFSLQKMVPQYEQLFLEPGISEGSA